VLTFALDDHTIRELGLSAERGADHLLARLDTTASPSGRAALRTVLHTPLSSREAILARQQALQRLGAPERDAVRALSALTEPLRAYLGSGYLPLPDSNVARTAVLWRYPEMASSIAAGLGVVARFVHLARGLVDALRQHETDDELAAALLDLHDGISSLRQAAPALVDAAAAQPRAVPLAADGPCRVTARRALEAAAAAAARLDALGALATWSLQPGMSWPTMHEAHGAALRLVRARSPLLAESVPLDLVLDAGTRLVLVTGPNAAGKSTALRTIAGLVHLAHVGCALPATAASMPVLRGLVSALHVSDDARTGASRYVAELRRLRTLRDTGEAAGSFLALIDEPLLGTSLTQGHATRRAVIEDLGRVSGGLWFIATHDLALAEALQEQTAVHCLAVSPWRAVAAQQAAALLAPGIAPDTDPAEVAEREYFRRAVG
jgi:DNA mismatch repair ATPase MutS